MTTQVNQIKEDIDLKKALIDIATDLATLKSVADALIADDGGTTAGDPTVGTLQTQINP